MNRNDSRRFPIPNTPPRIYQFSKTIDCTKVFRCIYSVTITQIAAVFFGKRRFFYIFRAVYVGKCSRDLRAVLRMQALTQIVTQTGRH